MPSDTTVMTWEEARTLLGVSADAGDAEVRAAYLEQVRLHPPDREPEVFERIRDAYGLLRDPAARASQILSGPDPTAPLADLLKGHKSQRRFIGAQLWLDALKEAAKEKRQ
jgi:curved DNA-binding protein CbpA